MYTSKDSILKKDPDPLHTLARAGELDQLFVYISLGFDDTKKDKDGKLYSDYLEEWQNDYILYRCNAQRCGKVWANVYKDTFDGYILHGYSSGGVPMLPIVWNNDMGLETLTRILDAGPDLDHPHLKSSDPPLEYAKVLAKYGWIPKSPIQDLIKTELDNYYPPEKWPVTIRDASFTIKPVGKTPYGLLGRTIVCISDTHWQHCRLHIPGGDILICAGDLCMPWHTDLTDYLLWMGKQIHPYKILVAGNHDKLIQNNKAKYLKICKEQNIIYLEDSGVEICGIKFWGSPWTPLRARNKNNAFTLSRTEIMEKWNQIPSDTNVLITHGPPYGIGDCNTEYYKSSPHQSGDHGLRKTINRLQSLKLHVFGHQHFGRGLYKSDSVNGGGNDVYFANAAIDYNPAALVFT